MADEKEANGKKASWLAAASVLLGLGSLGPANVYLFATDPRYLEKVHGWRVLLLPFGAWLLTGFLLQGLTIVWLGGIKHASDWQKRGEQAWEWWCKLGLWLIGIGIAIGIAALVFAGLASYLSSLDKGTVLIASLLLMILLALWRIGCQMRNR